MKAKKILSTLLLALLVAFSICGCGKGKESGPLVGNWAYIHDPETTIISLRDNGTALYNNHKYSYTLNGEYIELKNDDESISLRYEKNGEGFNLYQKTSYEYLGEGNATGIAGEWVNYSTKWSYEFTEDGSFKEDGYFPGIYSIDTENSTIKLMYNDHFEDTVIYYSLDGNVLTIDYPWTMVRRTK